MSYAAALATVLIASVIAAFVTTLIQRVVDVDFRRRHHDVGSVVFLQLGVVFAVLLAFVFSEAWTEYNQAAVAINLEVGAMHGAAMIASTLPPPQANIILTDELNYLKSVAYQEWPVLASNRAEDAKTEKKLVTLIQDAANLRADAQSETAKKTEMLSLLAQAHAERETRIYQAHNGIPVALWWVLIGFTVMLALFVSFSAIQHRATAVAFSACFAAGIVSILIIARLLDYPFEGALGLPPSDFISVIGKVSNSLGQANPS